MKKFQILRLPDEFLKTELIRIVKNDFGVELCKKDITINKGMVYIDANSCVKNEIYVKKTKLIKKINEMSINKTIKDIR